MKHNCLRSNADHSRACSPLFLPSHVPSTGRSTTPSRYPSHNYPITLREAKRIGLNVEPMVDAVNGLLFELNEIYSEMGQSAPNDFDEKNSHDNSILNVLESNGLLIYFQLDKDWHSRSEERRWVALNDKSSWRKAEAVKGKVTISQLHVR